MVELPPEDQRQHDDRTTCPECLEPYAHGEDPGATCLECREYQQNEQAQFEDELEHSLADSAEYDVDGEPWPPADLEDPEQAEDRP